MSVQRATYGLLLSFLLASACAKDEPPFHVEPQIAPPEAEHIAYDRADPTRLIIVEDAGSISTWRIDGETRERTLTIMTDAITACFAGESIVSVHRDRGLRLWTRAGRQLREVKLPGKAAPTVMEVTPKAILIGDSDGMVHVWSRDLKEHKAFALHEAGIVDIAPQPGNEATFATAAKDGRVRVWRMSSIEAPALIHALESREVLSLSMSRKGALAIADGGVTILDVAGVLHHNSQTVRYVSFSPTLEMVVGSGPGGPLVFNVDGVMRPFSHRPDAETVGRIAFVPTGDRFAATSRPWGFQIWTLDASLTTEPVSVTQEPLSNRYVASGAFMLVAPLSDGFVSANDAEVMFLDKFGTVLRREKLPAEYEGVSELATSSGHALVVVRTESGAVLVVDSEGRRVLAPNGIAHIAVSRLTGTIAMATEGKIRFVSPAGQQLRQDIQINDVRAMAFTLDDVLLAGLETELRWYSSEGRLLRSIPDVFGESSSSACLAVSSDGSRIAALTGYSVALYDENGKLITEIPGHGDEKVYALAFSPREPLMATSSWQATRFWNLDGTARGEALQMPMTPFGESMHLNSLAFSETQDLMIGGIEKARAVTVWSVDATRRTSIKADWAPAIDVMADSQMIATSDKLGLRFWTAAGQLVKTLHFAGLDETFHRVRFDRHGHRLLVTPSGTGGGETSLVDVETGKVTPLDYHLTSAFVGDRILHIGDELDRPIVTWEMSEEKPARFELPFKPTNLEALQNGRNQEVAVATFGEGPGRTTVVAVLNREDGLIWQETVSGWVESLAADPNSDSFAIGTAEGVVMVWERAGRRVWRRSPSFLAFERSDASALAFSPKAPKRLAVGTRNGTIAVYDFQRRRWINKVAIGFQIQRLGWNSERLWARLSSGQLVYLDHDLTLMATFTVNGEKAIITTPSGWYSGDDELVRFFAGPKRESVPKVDAATMYSAKNVAALVNGHGQSWRRISAWLDERGASVRRSIAKHSLAEISAVVLGSIYGLLLAAVFMVWIVRPDRVALWAMIPLASPNVPPLKRWMELLTVVGYLGHTNRAIEAWLRHARNELTALFDDTEYVVVRTRYVDLGNAGDIDQWRKDVAVSRPSAVWITGPGGCGKTTLAIQLARVAATFSRERPLPLLINTDWKGDLTDAVAARMTVDRKRPTRAMIECLADRGRIVLIVDGVSERRVADAAHAVESASVFRYRIVGSRGEPAEGSSFRRIEVGPLTHIQLRSFVEKYVPSAEVNDALEDINEFTDGQPIRPLFARLALDQRNASQGLPKSYPHLVQRYVLELAPRGPTALRAEDFLRAARIAGLACVEEDFAPRLISVEILRGHLRVHAQRLPFISDAKSQDTVSDVEIVDQMAGCGLLERVISLGVPQARFAFDPIAEYLGAMEIAAGGAAYTALRERVAKTVSALRDALQRVDGVRHQV